MNNAQWLYRGEACTPAGVLTSIDVPGVPFSAVDFNTLCDERYPNETHVSLTCFETAEKFLQASLDVGFVSEFDILTGRAEVTVEPARADGTPGDVYVFLGHDALHFAPQR
jgi:hypothetical protein